MSRWRDLAAAVELENGFKVGGERALVVGGSAAVDDAVFLDGGEGIDGPVGAVDGDDVFMCHEEDGALGAVAFETGDDAGAAGDGLEELVGDTFALEDGGDVFGDLALVAGRVLGVDADEVFGEGYGLGGGLVFAQLVLGAGGQGGEDTKAGDAKGAPAEFSHGRDRMPGGRLDVNVGGQ